MKVGDAAICADTQSIPCLNFYINTKLLCSSFEQCVEESALPTKSCRLLQSTLPLLLPRVVESDHGPAVLVVILYSYGDDRKLGD